MEAKGEHERAGEAPATVSVREVVAIELGAEIEAIPGAPEIRDGWRGLLDFGEKWAQDDADLWSPEWGDLPLGKPLTYGCELSRAPGEDRRVTIRLLVVDYRREVMKEGATFVLRDGHNARASGKLV